MTPKERRDRLFKHNRPQLRPLRIYDGDNYHKDIGILWVAYQKEKFEHFPPNLDQQTFAREIEHIANVKSLFLIEDSNKAFKDRGPVALVSIDSDAWRVEPHAEFFAWATPRNRLRLTVAFFQFIRHQQIGVCLVPSLRKSKLLFDHCVDYGVLKYVGKIENGDPRGDQFLYYIRGTKHARSR